MQPFDQAGLDQITALEKERLRIQAEISAYPGPIPACDVYFNDLLERRSKVCAQIDSLRASVNDPPNG